MPDSPLCIGLMSGTSLDGVDAVLLHCGPEPNLLATLESPLPPDIRTAAAALCRGGDGEIERLGVLDRQLGELFAEVTLALLAKSGHDPEEIRAIGSHGITLRHRPASGGHHTPFTLQAGDPNTIAEKTGITTVADFRRRDIAAGGEGAPLVPAFHAAVFGRVNETRAVVNIGGIANLTLLRNDQVLAGFDTGPGNTLLDFWAQKHLDTPCDRNGTWGAEGRAHQPLLEQLRSHPWLKRTGPRSTGKEMFNPDWLESQLQAYPDLPARDVQATLGELTAECIALSLQACDTDGIDAVYVCGGGAYNSDLMRRLYRLLSPTRLETTAALGVAPEWVEAAAFAWLAWRTLEGLSGNAPEVTGAQGERILGGIYPGRLRARRS
ncbi:anhydro-N-acetylmuramic acid kinase [Haliea atlantica]